MISQERERRRVLLAGLAVNIFAGMIYIWSIISKALIEDLQWTSSQASLPYTIFTISFVVSMVVFGSLQDTKGPKLVVGLGGLFMGLGLILSGIFLEAKALIFTVGILAGSGVGMITVASSPPVIKFYPADKKGLVTGIVVAGTGLSAIIYSPLASYLIDNYGIRTSFIVIGLIAMLPTIFMAQFLKNPDNPLDDQPKESLGKDYSWQEMIRTDDFYKLWLIFAFASSAGLMIIGHISKIAEIQINWQAGFLLVIILSSFNTLGRFLGGIISDKIGRINFIRSTLLLQLINMILFKYYASRLALIFGVAITGFCYGSNFSVFPAAISDRYGLKNYGINYGIIYTGWGLGGIIGPMLGAKVFDSYGNYERAYLVAGLLLILSIIISFFIRRTSES